MEKMTDKELSETIKNLKKGKHVPFINLTKENVGWLTGMMEEILELREENIQLRMKTPKQE